MTEIIVQAIGLLVSTFVWVKVNKMNKGIKDVNSDLYQFYEKKHPAFLSVLQVSVPVTLLGVSVAILFTIVGLFANAFLLLLT